MYGMRQSALAIVRPTAAQSSARNHWLDVSRRHFEEFAHRGGGEDQGEERAEAGDHRQHVALDRDVLAAGAALEQQHEGEAEHDQRRRRRGPPVLQRAAEDRVDEEEAEDRAERRRQPGRHGEGGQRAQQAAAVERPVRGRQGEHEGRHADRQEGGEGEVAGEEGEGPAGHGDEQDQRRRVDRLGQVEAAEPVDVAGDPPPLADRLGQAGELVLEQDDVGDPLGHLGARAHRHREPRLLQRRHVVDPVADHRRVAARGAQRLDQRLLLLGRDPAEDRVALRDYGELLRVLGQLGPVDHAGVVGHPDRVCHRRHRRPRVAGDQLQVDVGVAHHGDRRGGVGAQRLLQHDQRDRGQRRGRGVRRVVGQRLGRAGEGDDPPPRGRLLVQLARQPRRQLQRAARPARMSGAPST